MSKPKSKTGFVMIYWLHIWITCLLDEHRLFSFHVSQICPFCTIYRMLFCSLNKLCLHDAWTKHCTIVDRCKGKQSEAQCFAQRHFNMCWTSNWLSTLPPELQPTHYSAGGYAKEYHYCCCGSENVWILPVHVSHSTPEFHLLYLSQTGTWMFFSSILIHS